MSELLDDLRARGLVHDSTDLDALAERLDAGPLRLYYGCDPTAPSLHVGNLIGLLVLRRFADAGHEPVALVGGATGMVGDPGGRSEERNLLDDETLAANVAGIRAQVEAVVGSVADVVDNRDWTADVGVLEFLRDVGKHVTVNQMLAKESIKARVESEHGISFTEFSYMLLQANDYWHLHDADGVELQIGGSDQWGNIVAGVDMVRRRSHATVHAFTWPLMTRADGAKFGKSAGGAIWLDAALTSPYAFFQYWMNVDDRDVEPFLLQLTMLPVDEIRSVVEDHAEAPHARAAQRRLAGEVTALVHGRDAADAAAEASAVLFGGDPGAAGLGAWEVVADEVTTVGLPADASMADGIDPVPLLVQAQLAKSNNEARRLLREEAVVVTGRRLDEAGRITSDDVRHGRFVLLRKGRKSYAVVDLEKEPV
ncbi:tyrosine--tRNA ligase [Actinospongicola halichondriae]|uniref:tyrosine--tRNA ligase n=1 Tax=Actinospongicola halichondriae TaxID=3236844 RepID=UPI003D431A4D